MLSALSDWLAQGWIPSTFQPPSKQRKTKSSPDHLAYWCRHFLLCEFLAVLLEIRQNLDWFAIQLLCYNYTKTIIHLRVGKSDGYLSPPQWIIVNYVRNGQENLGFNYATSKTIKSNNGWLMIFWNWKKKIIIIIKKKPYENYFYLFTQQNMTERDSQETIVCVEGKIHVTVNSSYKSIGPHMV